MTEDVIRVLDSTELSPLNGKGEFLPDGAEPIWLAFTKDQVDAKACANSRGELYDPQPTWSDRAVASARHYVGPDQVVG